MNGRFSAIALLLIATSSVAGMAQVNGNEIVASATASSVTQNKDPKSRYKPKLGSGTLTGVVDRVDSSDGKAEFLWVKSRGVMHQFDIVRPQPAVVIGGDLSRKGTRVRVTYKNLELSEMDYFYTGNAVRIVVK